ncbi:class I adenylate-forming enzyme family protein [Catenuloplanes sp. NPDC051500]|uniref:class I adenylate-forming enzyme family protein n=1 Tax=Catenuloplanes sp. NPDC051500 TaxID=3363959 RepID=UPI0037A50317
MRVSQRRLRFGIDPSVEQADALVRWARDGNVAVLAEDATAAAEIAAQLGLDDSPSPETAYHPPAGLAEHPGGGVVLRTSGSSGRPKLVLRAPAALDEEGDLVAARLELAPGDGILCCVPLHHAFGLGVGTLAARASGAVLTTANPRTPRALTRMLAERPVRYLVASPAQIAHWSAGDAELDVPARFPVVITAGAPLGSAVADRFRRRFGVYPAQQYGSTETGSVTVDLSGGFTEGRVGRPYPRVEVVVSAAGRLVVRSGTVAVAYLGDPEASRAAGLDRGEFVTQDLGAVDEAGDVVLLGRVDRIANIDGKKFDPGLIERSVSGDGVVAEFAVVLTTNPDGITESSWVYASRDGDGADPHLRERAARLPAYQRPKRILRLDALPVSALGKVDHGALRSLVEGGH